MKIEIPIPTKLDNTSGLVNQLMEENKRLREALEAYPEWVADSPEDDDGYVSCLVCNGGGKFNKDGTRSKTLPPTHKPDCKRQLALRAPNSPQKVRGRNEMS